LSGEARRALPGEGVLNPNNCIPPSPPINCLLESGESKIGFPAPFLYPCLGRVPDSPAQLRRPHPLSSRRKSFYAMIRDPIHRMLRVMPKNTLLNDPERYGFI